MAAPREWCRGAQRSREAAAASRVQFSARMDALVVSVSRGASHSFSKQPLASIDLIAGQGVDGDAHRGATVKHRSRVARNPAQPNLRQVHLVHSELFGELAQGGFTVTPGDIGENVTTRG